MDWAERAREDGKRNPAGANIMQRAPVRRAAVQSRITEAGVQLPDITQAGMMQVNSRHKTGGGDVRWFWGETVQKKKAETGHSRRTETAGQAERIIQCAPDPVEEIALEGDMQETKALVDRMMGTLKDKIQRNDRMARRLRQRTGRDAWVYAGFFQRNNMLYQILEGWDESWSLRRTCGLLLDLGLALRELCNPMEIMNKRLSRGRNHVTHRVIRESKWATEDVPQGAELQSGPSATTGQLLRLLNQFRDVISAAEIEAVMTGAVDYWKNGSTIKWLLGDYHTAVEVWAVYMWYLQQHQQVREGAERQEE